MIAWSHPDGSDVSSEIRGRGSGVSGRVRLGLPDCYAGPRLAAAVSRFTRAHTDVHVIVRVDASHLLRMAVHNGQLDMALAIADGGEAGRESTLFSEKLVWAAAPDAAPVDPLPLVLMEAPCPLREAAIASLRSAGRAWHECVTTSSVRMLHHLVAGGCGVAPMPTSAVQARSSEFAVPGGMPDLPSLSVTLFENRPANGDAARALAVALRALADENGGGGKPSAGPAA